MADDSAILPMRPNSILADPLDFHSCRYSSWSIGRRDDPPRGSFRAKGADPWRNMEGELKRLDAANIKITEIDLLCMGDSDNVMYEFKLQEANSPTVSESLSSNNSSGDCPAGQHRRQQPSSASSQGVLTSSVCQLAHASGVSRSSSQGNLQHSLHAAPISSPKVHPTATKNSLLIGQPKTRVSQLVLASDAELEGYFSALESLQASPGDDGFDDGVSWADVDADVLQSEQLRSILCSAQLLESDLSPQSSSIRTASGESPALSCFSSPAHTLSPAGATSVASERGPMTSSIRTSRYLSPKKRTSTAPTEREGKGRGWPMFPPKSTSENASPARAGSRFREGSRLASACPAAVHSCGDLNQLARMNSEIANGSPQGGGYVVAETAVDLEALTSLHFSTPAQVRPAKSRLSRLHERQPGGSGPLRPRTEMDFGSRSMRGSISNSCEGSTKTCIQEETKHFEPMTPSRYVHSKKSFRQSRTLSWTGGDEVFDLFELVNSEAGADLDSLIGEGTKHAQGPSDAVASRVDKDLAESREGAIDLHKEAASEKKMSQLRSEKSLLGKIGRTLGWGKKLQHSHQSPAKVEKGEKEVAAVVAETAPGKICESPRVCTSDASSDKPLTTTNDETEVQRPSKYTMSRKKRQQLERMQFGLK